MFSSEEENTCPSINWRDPPFEHASAQQMVEKMYMDFARTSGSERTVAYMEDQLKQLRNTLEKAAEKVGETAVEQFPPSKSKISKYITSPIALSPMKAAS